MIERINRRRNVDLSKNNSPMKRIFSLAKINSQPEGGEGGGDRGDRGIGG